jgi:hypothetical protein
MLAACTKNNDQVSSVLKTPADKKPEACSFGLTTFNQTKRAPSTHDEYVGATKRKKDGEAQAPAGPPNATIFLDFDGQTVNGTLWNTNGGLACAPANLNSAEVDRILKRVGEDFAPFNVTITTDESVFNATNPHKRMRVVVTESWEWYGLVGGIAYYNSFTWGNNTPCFVFSTLLGYNEKYIAEAISHEVGHTIGLQHQASFTNTCNFISEYNLGAGEGQLGWAPIMGIGYYRNVTTWNKGAVSSGCGAVQDDVAMISGILGLKADVNTGFSKAVEVEQSVTGVINTQNDIDYYYVDLKNPAKITLDPHCLGDGVGANMNLRMNIYDKQGNLLRTVDNTASLNVEALMGRGKYYIGVETIENAYQNRYGMLGNYTLALN